MGSRGVVTSGSSTPKSMSHTINVMNTLETSDVDCNTHLFDSDASTTTDIELVTTELPQPVQRPRCSYQRQRRATKPKMLYYQQGMGKNKRYVCANCHKSYSKNSNLHRHMRKCLYASEATEYNSPSSESHDALTCDEGEGEMTIQDRNKLLKKENQLIKQQNQLIIREKKLIKQERDALKREIETMLVSFSQNINNNISMTQNIIINSWGNENVEYLTKNYLNSLLKIPYMSIQRLLKDIHFNPSHPENHNIKIPNRKEKFAIIYNNGRWNYKNKRDVIENMVNKSYNMLDSHFEDNKLALENVSRQQFAEFQSQYETDVKTKRSIAMDTELQILNNQKALASQ